MLNTYSILWFALGFAAGGIFISVTNFLLFLPKMRELDKEFNELRTENREFKHNCQYCLFQHSTDCPLEDGYHG